VGIFIGGAMLGVGGMFLSLPVMAVLKIVFDKSNHLRQWGILLGDPKDPKPGTSSSQP
jgi:predicted PurR-regulated permease PerM